MDAIRARLLSRYLAAANAMATASDGEAESDTAAFAMEALLRRQAALVARMHGGLAEPERARGVDGELLRRRLEDVASAATSRFYAYRFDGVPHRWRCLYTEARVLATHCRVLEALGGRDGRLGDGVLEAVVESLDRALIMAGGASARLGAAWIEETLQVLEAFWTACQDGGREARPGEPSPKRQRRAAPRRAFSTREPRGRPPMSAARECPRHASWTLDGFEAYMGRDGGNPRPVVFTDLIDGWPALAERPWNEPAYLLSRTFGGRRLVPVEVGRSYVDEGWGQELIPFRRFLVRYVDPGLGRPRGGDGGGGDDEDEQDEDDDKDGENDDKGGEDDDSSPRTEPAQTGYLAQHNLFHQIPSLRNDTTIPDLCWAAVPPHPTSPSKDRPRLDTPQLNAWFGPAGTITPLHTDAYHNLLCQVVGTKYVRLYPPTATPHMEPRPPEHGVDMSNTSGLDLGALEGWDPPPPGTCGHEHRRLLEARERLRGLEYTECVLRPGDALLIPMGWWHYVRSLSISFSVSFWWN